ncbi:MAG: hypothetical protein IKU21_07895 [Anaerotignum sp.]|nr:hypothetical protein [Anaerotignum sp.]
MTEQEKRRRRRAMERRMRAKAGYRKQEERKGGLTAFRIYVTAILTGGCLLISMFHTETSEMVCDKVKEVISVQISAEELMVWKERASEYLQKKDFVLPVFEEKKPEEKKVYRPDTEP